MKRLFVLLLVLVLSLSVSSASAITAGEFVERYNQAMGEGMWVKPYPDYYVNGFWFLSGSEMRIVIALKLGPFEDDPNDAEVLSVAVKKKPRISDSSFVNTIASALDAVYPDVPETERYADIARCLLTYDRVFGAYYGIQDFAITYHSEKMGDFVYSEETEYHTFMFDAPVPN